jgi:hypothetical protein
MKKFTQFITEKYEMDLNKDIAVEHAKEVLSIFIDKDNDQKTLQDAFKQVIVENELHNDFEDNKGNQEEIISELIDFIRNLDASGLTTVDSKVMESDMYINPTNVYDRKAILDNLLEAAFFVLPEEDAESKEYEDMTIHTVDEKIKEDLLVLIDKFIEDNKSILDRLEITDQMIGHDLLMTATRQGAGFWDRGYGEDGDILTKYVTDNFSETNPLYL